MSVSSSLPTVTPWTVVSQLDDIIDRTGVCAVVDRQQVAVFRVEDQVFALDNRDPFSGANVLSRGIIGDVDGDLVVASPLYKQRFQLADGRCLDHEERSVRAWAVRVENGIIEVSPPQG